MVEDGLCGVIHAVVAGGAASLRRSAHHTAGEHDVAGESMLQRLSDGSLG